MAAEGVHLYTAVYRIYDFACHTGLRQGEIFRLTWKNVDLKGGFFESKRLNRGKGGQYP